MFARGGGGGNRVGRRSGCGASLGPADGPHLAAFSSSCCRGAPRGGRTLPADAGTAWRHGLRLGLHCSHSCAGLMAIPLVIGVVDLRAMAVVAAAISVERLAPAGERVTRAIGAVVVGAGVFLIARAV